MIDMENLKNRNSKSSYIELDDSEPLLPKEEQTSKRGAWLLVSCVVVVSFVAVFGVSYAASNSRSTGESKPSLLTANAKAAIKADVKQPVRILDSIRARPVAEQAAASAVTPDAGDAQNSTETSVAAEADNFTAIVRDILTRVPLVDGHNDWPMKIRFLVDNAISQLNLTNLTDVMPGSQTDILRLREGQVGGQFWSVWVSCSAQYKDAVQYAIEQIDLIQNMVRLNPTVFDFVDAGEDILETHQSGLIASMIGIEGGHMIGNSLAVLRQLFELGARYLTLTHNCNTPWADNSQPEKDMLTPMNNGLTDWGKLVIEEMNRLGMLVDLAHVSPKVMADVLNVTQAPVIFSHSSAYSICPHPRNVPDDILALMKQNGGVVMVNFNPDFVNCTAENALDGIPRTASLSQVADHLDHLKSIVGAQGVGLGSDFDGVMGASVGLEDVSKFPSLLEEMLRRNWTVAEVEGLAGNNIIRVFTEVSVMGEQKERDPVVDTPFNYTLIPDTSCRDSPVV